MTEPTIEPKRKNAGLRQFVFAMMISAIASLVFFPSGHLAEGPVTQIAIQLMEQLREAVARTGYRLPSSSLRLR